jgi:hypothetical protein
MEKDEEIIDNLNPILLEYPFVRKGMTVSEYEKEKMYWGTHLEEVKAGTYIPLWKQKIMKNDEDKSTSQ